MTGDSSMRAGDIDRDRTVSVLTEAFTQGRLTEDEYHQRLDAAHRAVTFGDLAVLTADLPGAAAAGAAPPTAGSAATPSAAPPPQPAGPAYAPDPDRGQRRRKGIAAGWSSWAAVSVMMVVIWLFAGDSENKFTLSGFWPIWVIVPWGVAMVVASASSRGD